MINKAFYELLETVANDNGLEISDVKTAVETALSKAVQSEGHEGNIVIEFNDELKRIRIFECFTVVEEIEQHTERRGLLTLEEAKVRRPRAKVGLEFREEIPFSSIGRKGAFRYKQIFAQELRNAWVAKATAYFQALEGEIITATVERLTDNKVVLDLGMKVISYMPLDEGLLGDTYTKGKRIQVTITKVEETTKGPKVYVSRSQKEIIKRLFEQNVPEVAQGVVDIVALAREPGVRTKMGVKSNNPNVDAKGACVGAGGERIKKINAALNGERIDIFDWSDDPVKLIAEALTPAHCLCVLADQETRKAIVVVGDDQLTLAIGKGGQNVRLASMTTGWKIDIKDETAAYRDDIKVVYNVH